MTDPSGICSKKGPRIFIPSRLWEGVLAMHVWLWDLRYVQDNAADLDSATPDCCVWNLSIASSMVKLSARIERDECVLIW